MKPIGTYTVDFVNGKPVRKHRIIIRNFIHIRETGHKNVLCVFYAPGCTDYVEGDFDTFAAKLEAE